MAVGCYFSISDDGGNYWNFSYEARLFDPNDNQIANHNSWAYKPSFSSELSRNLTDPVGGTYKCKIHWWVEDFDLGEREATVTISYQVPTGETTESNGWWSSNTSVHKWMQTLTGGTFSGRVVTEQDPGGGGPDNCHFSGSIIAKAEAITGGSWTVGTDNRWGPDYVGWLGFAVEYYRNNGSSPCDTQFYQRMVINRPGSSDTEYVTQLLRMGITDISVWSERAGVEAWT